MKMKKMLWLLIFVLAAALTLCACGKEEKKPAESTKPVVTPDTTPTLTLAESNVYTVEKGNDAYHVSLTVANDTEILYLYQYVQAKEGVSWLLSRSIEATGDDTINSKTVQLQEGENTYYILCTGENNLFEIYTISIYRRHMYTISFENLTETQKVEEGSMATTPAAKPNKTGYTFVSWSFNFTTPITENVEVKANWKANTYTITYDPNGGHVAPATQTVTFGSEVTLPVPTRTGYDFAGWQKGDTLYQNGVWDTASDITLTAIWDYSAFTVTLLPEGGSLAEETVQVHYGAAYQLPTPTREGYVFAGWYDGEEAVDVTGIWSRMEGVTLTAKWEVSDMKSISCTMIANGGSVLPQTQLLGVGAKLPVPVRNGYTFGGWFTDDTLTIAVDAITDDLIDRYGTNLRLYAWWQEEGKPGEFVYELQGIYCVVTAYKNDVDPQPTIPAYIGGRQVKVAIKPPANPNAGITVKDSFTLTVGDASVIHATFVPAYDSDSRVLQYTTDSDCIHLGKTGSVSALKPGTAVVTITNEDGTYSATCTVTVLGRPNDNPGITVTESEITVEQGKSYPLSITFVPEREGDSLALTYTFDGDIISITDDVVEAHLPGTVVVTVSAAEGKYTATFTVIVTERVPDPNAGITVESDEITVEEGNGGKIVASVVPVYPEHSTEITYTCDSDCIELSADGSFTAIKEGTAVVTLQAEGGLSASVTVVVTAKAVEPELPNENAGLSVGVMSANLYVSDEIDVSYTYVPVYESDDKTISVEVTAEGIVAFKVEENVIKVTALAAGEVVLKVTAGEFSANVTVTVSEAEEDEPIVEPDAPVEPDEPVMPDLPEDTFE